MTEKRVRIQLVRAFGELVLIVAGVLIALGAESAWEDRGEGIRANAYLEALHSDMAQARTQVEAVISATQIQLELTDSILDGLRGVDGGSEFLDRGSHALGGVLILPTGTLDALLETGDVNLLSPELRAAVVATHSILRRVEGLADDYRTAALENLTRYLEARETLALNIPRDRPLPIEAARRVPRIVSSVETHRFLLSQRLRTFEGLISALDDILNALETSVDA
jgi:hypothetical protein